MKWSPSISPWSQVKIDQRMAVFAGRLEVGQQAADLIVDLADHPVIGGAQLAQLALVDVLQHRGVMLGIGPISR